MMSSPVPHEIRPVPRLGSRPEDSSLLGMDRPRIRLIATNTKGMAVGHPGVDTYRVTSDWVMPMANPATMVIGKDENRPTMAAARTGITISERFSLLRLVIGASRMAAMPPKAAPMAQFSSPMRLGETPSVAAAREFSATALVATPKVVNL